ncbi:transcription factor Adf-1-like [Ornithodoros turicata]|uniref:transcription factor Adf-1-like n=1 Tax=Ornithodoros turicata TaxID=34597 RepID=UPI0031387915
MASHHTAANMVSVQKNSLDTTLTKHEMICIEVEKRPWLYDNSRADYKDALKRENTWAAIGREVSMTACDCQKTWRGIRDRYARELRASEEKRSGMSAAGVYKSNWPLFTTLDFLKEFIRPRSKVRSSAHPAQEFSPKAI